MESVWNNVLKRPIVQFWSLAIEIQPKMHAYPYLTWPAASFSHPPGRSTVISLLYVWSVLVVYTINTLPSHKRLAEINERIKRCMFCCARFWYRLFYYTQHVLSNMLLKFWIVDLFIKLYWFWCCQSGISRIRLDQSTSMEICMIYRRDSVLKKK